MEKTSAEKKRKNFKPSPEGLAEEVERLRSQLELVTLSARANQSLWVYVNGLLKNKPDTERDKIRCDNTITELKELLRKIEGVGVVDLTGVYMDMFNNAMAARKIARKAYMSGNKVKWLKYCAVKRVWAMAADKVMYAIMPF